MKDIKQVTEAQVRRLVMTVYEGGRKATLAGVTLLNDDNDFILGALIHATYRVYSTAKGEEKDNLRAALLLFFSWTVDAPCGTWGKMSLLSVLCDMKAAGELSLLPTAVTDALREKTDIDDFYDKEAHTLRGKAANYMHVAATCAARRALLGWETNEMASAIANRLLEVIASAGGNGFLDDQPNEGCFDSYTFLVTTALPTQCREAGLPLPDYALANIRTAATAMLHMANARGDGFVYGRSLSVYGDISPVGVLITAMQEGLLTEAEQEMAYAYILAIFDKIHRFWYDEGRGIFNIWFDGRATDGYREAHRLLEVNLDIAKKIFSAVTALEELGLWGRPPRVAIPCPAQWTAHTVRFLDTEEKKAAAVILRRRDTLVMLPLVGSGSLSRFPAYLPFPAIAGVLEAAPQSDAPYLVPQYERDEEILRPIQYYTDITVTEQADRIAIKARGNLCATCEYPARPTALPYTFAAEYIFEGDTISARFETDLADGGMRMHTAKAAIPVQIEAWGFADERARPTGEKSTLAPHGAYTELMEYTAPSPRTVGWRTVLPK